MRGQPADAGVTKFDLSLPACPATTLHLNLPANCTLESSAGIVTLETLHGPDRQWRVQLGGQNRTTLQVTKSDLTHAQSVLVLAETLHAYDLSLKGVVLTARLDLDVVEGPIRRLTLQADRDLQLISAKIGDGELGVSRSTGDEAGFESWTIDFLQPVPAGKYSIEIAAVAPLLLDKTWQLPKVSLPAAHWVNGRAILRLAAPLQLSDLTCEECNPTAARRDEANDSEQIEFQCLTKSSEIKLIVSRPQGRPQVSTSTSITLGPSEVAAQCVAKLSMEEGARYSVEADVPAQWIIDSLESDPAGRVAAWTHEALPGRGGKLRVQLQTPLARDHALWAAFGEYLAQMAGGVAMSQGEIVRPADLGIEDAAAVFAADPAASRLIREGNTDALPPAPGRAHGRGRLRRARRWRTNPSSWCATSSGASPRIIARMPIAGIARMC